MPDMSWNTTGYQTWIASLCVACLCVIAGGAAILWPALFRRRLSFLVATTLLLAVLALATNELISRLGWVVLLGLEVILIVLVRALQRVFHSSGARSPAWMGLTLLLGGLGLLGWLAGQLDQVPELEPDQIARIVALHPWNTRQQGQAVTDLGTPIPLYAYQDEAEPRLALAPQVERAFANNIIRVEPASPTYNCHGWTFTGGRYHIASTYVELILRENGYQKVDQPQVNDVIVYRNDAGDITHTGIVRATGDDGFVLIESKWDVLGRYLHDAHLQPYSESFGYYHTPRKQHLLEGLDASVPAAGAD